MKKCLFVLICVVLFLVFLGSCNRSQEKEEPYSIYTKITEGVFLEHVSKTDNSIFFSQDLESGKRSYIIESKLIYRYSYENDLIAYHWNELSDNISENSVIRSVNSSQYSIESDFFTIFDLNSKTYNNFYTQKDFLDYCKKEKVDFIWEYPNGFTIKKIAETHDSDKWCVYDFDTESLCGYIVKNNEIVYEGYVSDVILDNQGILTFRLQIPHKSLLEFQDLSFNDLNVSFNKVVGKYKTFPLLYEDIYYDQYVRIDTKNNIIQELSGCTDKTGDG